MTEEEYRISLDEYLLSFERKVKRFQDAKDQNDLLSVMPPNSDDYYSAAMDLGADLLLQMSEALRERPMLIKQLAVASAELADALNERDKLRRSVEALKDQFESARHEAAAVAVLHERAEAELVGLRQQVLDMGVFTRLWGRVPRPDEARQSRIG